MSDKPEMLIVGGVYRHWKQGDLYEIISIKHMPQKGKLSVLYKPLYECEFESFSRDIDDFLAIVTPPGSAGPMPRFELIDHPPASDVLTRMVPALKTAAEADPLSSSIAKVWCSNPQCAYNIDYVNDRHLCCDPYCPIPGTPGYKSHHPDPRE